MRTQRIWTGRPTKATAAAVLLLAGMALAAARADAATLKWRFTSHHEYIVQLEFYSQARNHIWPGNDQAYELRDSKAHTFTLSCQSGEKICYGAWVKGDTDEYWGVGPDDEESCDDCCAVCGSGETQVIDLVD
jgi:hypothetical protein